MKYSVEITEKAERAVRNIILWIAEFSAEKASEWYFDFLDATVTLENFPNRCAMIPEIENEPTFRHLLFGNYRIIFRIEENTVYVLQVRHQKQKPLRPQDI
jgi:toxin ParE1/3/4